MSNLRTYEVRYHPLRGNDGLQITRLQASSPDAARRIFAQQNPGCRISTVYEVR